ncbi:MAG: transposase [Candidatus Pacebacteria bacterium]|nr:transposase [Candidatus Paceibacterota bacterium]
MQNIDKIKLHWPNNSVYFLTGSTFLHYPYFKTNEQKQIVLNQIKKLKDKLNIKIIAYSIAINHYHLKFYLKSGLDIAKVKQLMHGGVTFKYKKEYKMKYREMWQSKKVLVITSDEMDWKTTGYIIGNLLKHKEVSTFEELENDSFSSYKFIVKRYSDECAQELVRKVINVDESIEGEVDFKNLKKLSIIRPKIY